MVNLGYIYNNGIGVNQDPAKAVEWNLKAAERGEPSDMFNLSRLYAMGNSVNADFGKIRVLAKSIR